MPKKILLVDDDPDFLEQLTLQLEHAGFEVLTAESSAEAGKIIENQSFDLAIVDLMLEHYDGGFSLAYQVKKKDHAIPVIMVTAVASETGMDFDAATEEERSFLKADVVLNKPIRLEQLLREMKKLFKGWTDGYFTCLSS